MWIFRTIVVRCHIGKRFVFMPSFPPRPRDRSGLTKGNGLFIIFLYDMLPATLFVSENGTRSMIVCTERRRPQNPSISLQLNAAYQRSSKDSCQCSMLNAHSTAVTQADKRECEGRQWAARYPQKQLAGRHSAHVCNISPKERGDTA